MPDAYDVDSEVRRRAFQFLDELRQRYGDSLPRRALEQGFEFGSERVPLLGPAGIFKPGILREPIALSVTSVPESKRKPRPYDDSFDAEQGVIHYKYRGTDPRKADNRWVRAAMDKSAPIIYFHGLIPGRYLAMYPVYVVGDDMARLTFKIQVDDPRSIGANAPAQEDDAIRRGYITTQVQRRIHQQAFRARVLQAYRDSCAVCSLRHEELLDAAHILEDQHPKGEPVITNGLALCKIHHAAFDRNILGIRADYVMQVRKDILEEEDGPMLRHGLQELHSRKLFVLPVDQRQQPSRELLEERFEVFCRAQ